MQEIILAKMGELTLKGMNRSHFEATLVQNIRRRLQSLGAFDIRRSQSTLHIEPRDENVDLDEAARRVSQVFGLAALSRAGVAEKSMDAIRALTPRYLAGELAEARTFKVEAKRSDKTFPLNSPQICAAIGEHLLSLFPHLRVDVHAPDLVVTVEVREFDAYIRGGVIPGAGGIPVGTGGKAALLISGGIDSPVAGHMMARRGMALTAVHFASPPYTSPRAEMKVHDLLRALAPYTGRMRMLTVPFTEIQEAIYKSCPEDFFTILMRRSMMRVTEQLARARGIPALITGESLGQVASQTIQAIACTDAATSLPVLRPLIGMDKDEIVARARLIGTFETSILPYEDCCTVFTPKHPKTRPKLHEVTAAEALIPLDALCQRAAEGVRESVIPLP